MRRVKIGLAAGLLAGAGCKHCGDRPRLFDSYRERQSECRDDCRPASGPRLGAPLRGQPVSNPGGLSGPLLPGYAVLPDRPPASDLLPFPGSGGGTETLPPQGVPLAPTTPAVPIGSLLPPPSSQPAGR